MDAQGTTTPARAGRREWIGLAVLAMPTLLLALDMSVLHLALPAMTADLQPSSSQLLWIMDSYGFMIAGFLVTMGTLGDRIGRRKLLLIGAAAFGAASVLAAYSTSAEMLIAARAALGVAGATLMPSTLALISNMFTDGKQKSLAFAVWMSCFMGGTAIGPVVGGVLLGAFWWGSVFLLGVPVMLLLLATGPTLLPEFRDEGANQRLDLVSVLLSLGAILPVVYGLKELAKDGLGLESALALLAGVTVGALFVRRQLRLDDPLLDLSLFRNASFRTAVAVFLTTGFFMGGLFMFISQFLQLVNGLSAVQAGMWMLPPAIGMIIGTMAGPAITQRLGAWQVIGGGLVVSTVGIVLLTQLDPSSSPLLLITGMTIASIGFGPGGALVTEIIVSSAPPEKAGSAASLSETSAEFGIATGVAVLGSIGTAIYRSELTVPDGVPAPAGESLANAVAVAGELPGKLADALLVSARGAFTSGLTTTAWLATGALIGVAVAVFAHLRRLKAQAPPTTVREPALT